VGARMTGRPGRGLKASGGHGRAPGAKNRFLVRHTTTDSDTAAGSPGPGFRSYPGGNIFFWRDISGHFGTSPHFIAGRFVSNAWRNSGHDGATPPRRAVTRTGPGRAPRAHLPNSFALGCCELDSDKILKKDGGRPRPWEFAGPRPVPLAFFPEPLLDPRRLDVRTEIRTAMASTRAPDPGLVGVRSHGSDRGPGIGAFRIRGRWRRIT